MRKCCSAICDSMLALSAHSLHCAVVEKPTYYIEAYNMSIYA